MARFLLVLFYRKEKKKSHGKEEEPVREETHAWKLFSHGAGSY
jgi:hypothetical protein